jgi:hypothetical protein
MKLLSTTKEFIEKVHDAYVMHLKVFFFNDYQAEIDRLYFFLQDLPRCFPHETVWWTMASQLIVYAQAVMNFCQKTIPGKI